MEFLCSCGFSLSNLYVPRSTYGTTAPSASRLQAPPKAEEVLMLDILFIVIGLAFLGAAMLYVRACDRL